MKEFVLTNGMIAKISDEDYSRVTTAGNWYADEHGHGKRIYIYRRFNGKKVYLHKFILEYNGPDDIDHDDGDGLNCQRENLIIKSRSWNNLNNHNIRSDNTAGIIGVYYDKAWMVWKAEIKVNGKKFRLGNHKTKEAAILARQQAEEDVKAGREPLQPTTRAKRIDAGKKRE